MCSQSDSGPVVPTTPLIAFLERLQLTALKTFGSTNFDPKTYVDLSLKFTLSKTQLAFDNLPKSSNGSVSATDLNGFIESFLNAAGEDLVDAEPPNFVPEPKGFLPAVVNPVVREWALEVHSLWKNLSRRVDEGVLEHPELHTLLPLSKPVVIPGSRFREVYYWDSYWDGYKWVASNQNRNIFASNFIPISVKLFNSDLKLVEKVRQSLQRSGLIRAAGIATSLTNSGQQWDFPNGWAPLQHLIVEGLVKSGSKEAKSLAKDIAVSWIRTNYVAYKKTSFMQEKYDVEKCGELGGGGEYIPQKGFGWSNGVVLAFLEEFGWPKDLKIDC
ncbi:hypothetical protein Vadar_027898 [Vaccinium darrowii]|uniref:Uncharacterized protein n=1 Tax=Vaccinium darrowii TaxID=229202 RepID=A0ACB7XKV6_9ERIC|nr:hypothetical protein Vadar_027898 [Vaccinium darrowii]